MSEDEATIIARIDRVLRLALFLTATSVAVGMLLGLAVIGLLSLSE